MVARFLICYLWMNKSKDQFYRLPHNGDFSQIAAMFDLKYAHPYTWADLNSIVKQVYSRRKQR